MECKTALEQLTEYLEGRLPQQAAAAMRQHLDTCASCSRAAGDLQALARALRAVPLAPLPAAFEPQLRQRLDRTSSLPLARFLIAGAAGAILVIISFGILRVTHPSRVRMVSGGLHRGAFQVSEKPMRQPTAAPAPAIVGTQQPYSRPPEEAAKGPAGPGALPASKGAAAARGVGEAFTPQEQAARAGRPTYGIPPSQAAGEKALGLQGPRERRQPPPAVQKTLPPLTVMPQEKARSAAQESGGPGQRVPARAGKESQAGPAGPPTPPAVATAKPHIAVMPIPPSQPPMATAESRALRRAGWLGYARVRLSPSTVQQRAQAALSIELPAPEQRQQSLDRLGRQQSPENQIRASLRPVAPPGPAFAVGVATTPATGAQGANANLPINLPRGVGVQRGVPKEPGGEVYELTLSTADGQSLPFLLFTPGMRPARWTPSLRSQPLHALSRLTSDAGVWLLTPADLGAGLVVTIAAPPADALTALLGALRLDVYRDGKFWTASRY